MKVRKGFVSNSSSSSFVIRCSDITDEQVNLIHSHKVFAKERAWHIQTYYGFIMGSSDSMRYDMKAYLSNIEVPDEAIMWACS